MAIPLVQVRHKVTGKKTFLPETALPNFPDYVKTPSQKAREQVPDGTAFVGQVVDDEPVEVAAKPAEKKSDASK